MQSYFKTCITFLVVTTFLLFSFTNVEATIYYVTQNGGNNSSSGNSGSSWQNALSETEFRTQLINTNSMDTFYVAAGIYKPIVPANINSVTTTEREATFLLKIGVKMYGGFAGTETGTHSQMLAARYITTNKTILSGDIDNNDTSDIVGSNSYHVVTGQINATTENVEIDGFYITSGDANSDTHPHNSGGGMYNNGSSPTVKNCTFISNKASGNNADGAGGGMYNSKSSPIIKDCNFFSNNAEYNGGGICNYGGSSPEITNCIFRSNETKVNGGGICNYGGSSPKIKNCSFVSNKATIGGGIYNQDIGTYPHIENCTFLENTTSSNGGGIMNNNCNSTITCCTFLKNKAKGGGGICNFSNNNAVAKIINCTFSENEAITYGGGLWNVNYTPIVVNCTFYSNSANIDGGGMYTSETQTQTIVNSIFWANTAAQNTYSQLNNLSDINYCVVQDGTNIIFPGQGNIFTDPLLQPLAYNSGPTQTCAISNTGPAYRAGTTTLIVNNVNIIPDTDQRGIPRTDGIDIGAYQSQTVHIAENSDNIKINYITPIPASVEANLNLCISKTGRLDVSIYDISGIKLLEVVNGQRVEADTELTVPLNLQSLTNGIYIIVISVGNEKAICNLVINK